MEFRNRINTFERGAQRQFSNFGGSQFQNADGAGMLDPNGRTLTITVQNTNTATSKTAYIFGSIYDLTDTLQDAAITITVAEASSYLSLKTDLLSSPIRIFGARYNVTTVAQLSQPWNIIRQTPTGEYDSRYVQPISYRSAQNTITTQVDMMSFALLVTKDVRLSFTLVASEIVTFTFYIKEKVDVSDVLKGQNVVRSTNQTVPTGLPQIDMLGQNF
jgi:hypothetical protein